jgi:hypothetical protein
MTTFFFFPRLICSEIGPRSVGRLHCCWFSPAQYLVSIPVKTHDHIFLFKTNTFCETGPPVQREDGSDYYWSLPLYWGRLEGSLNSLTRPLLHLYTQSKVKKGKVLPVLT